MPNGWPKPKPGANGLPPVRAAIVLVQLCGHSIIVPCAIIYGTISRLPALDYLLERVLDRPLHKLDPAIRTILRAGAWQLYHAHAVPPSAAVNESVKLAQHLTNLGAAKLVNACLRRLAASDRPELPANRPALAAGLPGELFGYLKKWYGREEAIALATAALENLATTTVRVNLCRTTGRRVQESLTREGVESEPGLFARKRCASTSTAARSARLLLSRKARSRHRMRLPCWLRTLPIQSQAGA